MPLPKLAAIKPQDEAPMGLPSLPEPQDVITEDADAVQRQILTGDPRLKGQILMEDFVQPVIEDPVSTVIKPTAGAVADFGSGALTMASGVQQAALEVALRGAGLPGEVARGVTDEFITKPEQERQERFASAREGVFGEPPGIGTVLGEAALPISPRSKATLLERLLEAGRVGAISGGLEFTDEGSERAINTLYGVIGGPLAQGGFELLGKARGLFSDVARVESALDSPKLNSKDVRQVIDAANDLGIPVTPGEATGEVWLVGSEGNLSLNNATKGELQEFLSKRHEDLLNQLSILKRDAIGDASSIPELDTAIGDMVGEVYNASISRKNLEELMQRSPVFASVWKKYRSAVEANAIGKGLTNEQAIIMERMEQLVGNGGVANPLSVGFLDRVIQDLDKLVEGTASASDKGALSSSRKFVSDFLKDNVPGFADMKALQQRKLAVRFIEDKISEVPDTTSGVIASGFYNNVLKTPKNRQELISLMESVPGAEQKIKNLSKVMGSIFGDKGFEKALLKRSPDLLAQGGTAGLGPTGAALVRMKAFFSSKTDRALMEYITNPAWTQDISKLVAKGDRLQTMSNIAAYFQRVSNVRSSLDERSPTISTAQEVLQNPGAMFGL